MATGLACPDGLAQFNGQQTDQQSGTEQCQTVERVRQRHRGHHQQGDHKDMAIEAVTAPHQALQRKRPRIKAIRMAT